MTKTALITGVTGQDGSYLAEFLLEKGYEVHGIKRRSSLFNTQRVDHIYQDPHVDHARFQLHYGDLSDTSNLTRIIQDVRPDEVYNLGAQSHVAVSFEAPEYTADVDAMGTLRLLEAIRFLGLEKKTRFYQASTSELYGLVQETPQTETTPFHPRLAPLNLNPRRKPEARRRDPGAHRHPQRERDHRPLCEARHAQGPRSARPAHPAVGRERRPTAAQHLCRHRSQDDSPDIPPRRHCGARAALGPVATSSPPLLFARRPGPVRSSWWRLPQPPDRSKGGCGGAEHRTRSCLNQSPDHVNKSSHL